MKRKPYHPQESILARGVGSMIIWVGILVGLVSFLSGYLFWDGQTAAAHEQASEWQTLIFTTLTFAARWPMSWAIRSDYDSLFKIGVFSNLPMVRAVLLTIALQLALLYVPFLQNIFNTVPLSADHLALSVGLSAIVFVVIELQKRIKRRLAR